MDKQFRDQCARKYGCAPEDVDWHWQRNAFRQWQSNGLANRQRRLAPLHASGAVLFCPRCTAACGWHTTAEDVAGYDLEPIDGDIFCSACDEHFEVQSKPSPYGAHNKGWSLRRCVAVGRKWLGAMGTRGEQE